MATVTVTVSSVAKAFAVCTRTDARARWSVAHQILQLCSAAAEGKDRHAVQKSIGAACAAEVGRINADGSARPYGQQWVSGYCNAARKYPQIPADAAEARDFLEVVNNTSKAKKDRKGSAMSADDALKMLKAAAKAALKRGATEDQCSAALAEAFDAAAQSAAA